MNPYVGVKGPSGEQGFCRLSQTILYFSSFDPEDGGSEEVPKSNKKQYNYNYII